MPDSFPARPLLAIGYAIAWLTVAALALQPSLAPAHLGGWSSAQLAVLVPVIVALGAAAWALVGDRPARLARWLRAGRVRLVTALALPIAGALAAPAASVAWSVPWTVALLSAWVGAVLVSAVWSLFVVSAARRDAAARPATKKLAAVWAAVLVALGLAELAGQLLLPAGAFAWHLNPPLLRARFRTAEFDTTVTTNGQGYRGGASYPPEHPGRIRVIVIGDSMTFGWGVDDDETFPAVAEQLANQRAGRPAVEVVNMGRAGQSPLDYLRTLRRYGPPLRPDLVVIGFLVGNDCPVWPPVRLANGRQVERRLHSFAAVARGESAAWVWHRSFVARLVHSGLRRARSWYVHRGRQGEVGPVWGEPNPLDPPTIAAAIQRQPHPDQARAAYRAALEHGWVAEGLAWRVTPWLVRSAILHPHGLADAMGARRETRAALGFEWQLCAGLLAEMNRFTRTELGAELLVMVIPAAYQIDERYHEFPKALGCEMPPSLLSESVINDWMAEHCRREAITCVDLLRTFREHPDRQTLYFARDAHLTAAGQRLLGAALADELLSRVACRPPGGGVPLPRAVRAAQLSSR